MLKVPHNPEQGEQGFRVFILTKKAWLCLTMLPVTIVFEGGIMKFYMLLW